MLEEKSAFLRYHVYQFSDKMGNFQFLGPKNGFWGRNFKNLSLDLEIKTSKIPCVTIFCKNGQLLIFCPKFG